MKVLYDHQAFSIQRYGGISRYFAELMNAFFGKGVVNCRLALRVSDNDYLKSMHREGGSLYGEDRSNSERKKALSGYRSVAEVFLRKVLCESMGYRLNGRESIRALQEQDFDLFHPTYFNPYFLSYLGKKPFLLTVYDMIHELFPEMFSSADRTSFWKRELVFKAAKIIAISNNTRDDLVRYYGISEEKVVVTYLGPSGFPDGDRAACGFSLPGKYILFVGNRDKPFPLKERYKNFTFFVESLLPLFREKEDLRLFCAGGGIFNRQERRLFAEHGISGKVLHDPASGGVSADLYRKATLFVLPSLYEGFGLPVLEAFSCGCPVAVSQTSALPEVAGNAAIYFDPRNADSIRESVRKVLEDEMLQEHLRSEGFKQLRNFSWAKTAEGTKAVYESVLA
jgi:glycosyltransferase involved in cell wall biosynthesis